MAQNLFKVLQGVLTVHFKECSLLPFVTICTKIFSNLKPGTHPLQRSLSDSSQIHANALAVICQHACLLLSSHADRLQSKHRWATASKVVLTTQKHPSPQKQLKVQMKTPDSHMPPQAMQARLPSKCSHDANTATAPSQPCFVLARRFCSTFLPPHSDGCI